MSLRFAFMILLLALPVLSIGESKSIIGDKGNIISHTQGDVLITYNERTVRAKKFNGNIFGPDDIRELNKFLRESAGKLVYIYLITDCPYIGAEKIKFYATCNRTKEDQDLCRAIGSTSWMIEGKSYDYNCAEALQEFSELTIDGSGYEVKVPESDPFRWRRRDDDEYDPYYYFAGYFIVSELAASDKNAFKLKSIPSEKILLQ